MTVLLCSTSVEGQLEVARFWSPVCQASSGKTLWLEATVQRGLEPSAGSLCSHIWLSAGTSAGRKTRMTSTGGLATLSLHAWYLDFHTAGRPGSGERGGYAWCVRIPRLPPASGRAGAPKGPPVFKGNTVLCPPSDGKVARPHGKASTVVGSPCRDRVRYMQSETKAHWIRHPQTPPVN